MNPCCHDGSWKITKGKIVFLLAAIIVVKSFGLVVVQWARVVNLLLSTNPTHPWSIIWEVKNIRPPLTYCVTKLKVTSSVLVEKKEKDPEASIYWPLHSYPNSRRKPTWSCFMPRCLLTWNYLWTWWKKMPFMSWCLPTTNITSQYYQVRKWGAPSWTWRKTWERQLLTLWKDCLSASHLIIGLLRLIITTLELLAISLTRLSSSTILPLVSSCIWRQVGDGFYWCARQQEGEDCWCRQNLCSYHWYHCQPTWTHLGRSWKRWESVMSTALIMFFSSHASNSMRSKHKWRKH